MSKLFHSLKEAISSDDSERVSELLANSSPRDVLSALSWKSNDEWSVLMRAAGKGNVDVVNQLLAAKAQVDDQVGGITALMACCIQAPPHSAAEVASALLQAKASPNFIDRYRETCLIKAAARGLADVLHVLLNAGADVNARDNNDHAALYHAANARHTAAVKCLLQAGTDEQAKNDALEVAQAREFKDIIEILAPESVQLEEERRVVLPERYTFSKKVLAELPVGDGRVGFPADVSLLLSGVGLSHYSAALLAAGFGAAQVINANDKTLRAGGVWFAPQRRSIMDGMVRMAVHSWGDGSIPEVKCITSAVHCLCNAVRQIHIMWATTVLGRDRADPELESDPDSTGHFARLLLDVTEGIVREADEIRRRATIVAKLAEHKKWTDPVAPADLLRSGV